MNLIINSKKIELKLLNTETSKIISKYKGFKSNIKTWGEEIYFKTPITGVKLEKSAIDIIEYGEVAYWVEGSSIAIGFGPTPASLSNEIRLVTKVNIWAKFNSNLIDIDFFKKLRDNDTIELIN